MFGVVGRIIRDLPVGPILGFAWLYQDWGIIGYNLTKRHAFPLGSALISYVTSFGTMYTFARVAINIGANPTDIAAFIIFLFILLLPPCLIVTIFFHAIQEPNLLKKLEKGHRSRHSLEVLHDRMSTPRTERRIPSISRAAF